MSDLMLRGTLRHRPLPPVRSVEAYLGVEFSLVSPDGQVFALDPGPLRERLEALDGQPVTLRVRPAVASASSPFEAAPLGPDGKPLGRPSRHEVIEVLS